MGAAFWEPWIWLSVMAAGFQTVRFMLQKALSMGAVSALGATFARFAYAAPLAMAMAAGYLLWSSPGGAAPSLGSWFWPYALVGGAAQIVATWMVVLLFAERNFAVGVTFKKTEVVQTALVGVVVLGDAVSLAAAVSILLGLGGVLLLSDPPKAEAEGDAPALRGWRRFANRAAGLGVASGAFFAISAVTYRGATLEVGSEDPLLRGLVTVAAVTAAQSLSMTLYLLHYEPGQLTKVWAARATAVWIGVASLAGSIGWFTAFTLQNAAYVFAVGQVEVIFSILVSVLVFGERITWREAAGMAVLTASILGLVLLGA
ncbi:MAG: EamA/RhaT family transporter [Pseudomonadota bacterium]